MLGKHQAMSQMTNKSDYSRTWRHCWHLVLWSIKYSYRLPAELWILASVSNFNHSNSTNHIYHVQFRARSHAYWPIFRFVETRYTTINCQLKCKNRRLFQYKWSDRNAKSTNNKIEWKWKIIKYEVYCV